MPAYSFKQQFVPLVLDGSKDQTIRGRRKNFAKPGDSLYLYFGLRTKHCRKLREETCRDATTIYISKNRIILFESRLDDYAADLTLKKPLHPLLKSVRCPDLSPKEMNQLAWRDGFRPAGSRYDRPKDSFELMLSFWTGTHALPWIGDIIYWTPSKSGLLVTETNKSK